MIEDIDTFNDKKQRHGYQEWYLSNNEIWFRGMYKNNNPIGYAEENTYFTEVGIGQVGTEVQFYIR